MNIFFDESLISSNYQSIFAVRLNNRSYLVDQLIGKKAIDPDVITNMEEFDSLYKIRHDLIHAIICDVKSIRFGERSVEEIIKEAKFTIINNKYFDLVGKQTPDYLSINGSEGHLLEISVSRSDKMKQSKIAKYSLLNHFFRVNRCNIKNEYIIINPDFVYRDRDALIKIHHLNDGALDSIKFICDKTREIEAVVKSTEMGRNYILQRQNVMGDEDNIRIDFDTVKSLYDALPNKVFHSSVDFKDICLQESKKDDDDSFLDYCVSIISTVKPKLASSEIFDEEIIKLSVDNESKRLNGKLQRNYRSILPLPFIRSKSMDAADRSTESDYASTCLIAMKMMRSDDVILSSFGKAFLDTHNKEETKTGYPFSVRFTKDMKANIALEGPNRKHYVRYPDLYPKHVERQKEHSMYSMAFDVNVDDLHKLSLELSKHEQLNETKDIYQDTFDMSNLEGLGLDYVKCCQSIYREVNINSMRASRRKNHLLRPTGIKGIYVLIYKGPKLRVGEVPSQVWFKVISDNELVDMIPLSPSWAFKRMINSKTVSHSGWLSVDAHRLDHYIRAYDKILMAYYSMRIMRYRTTFMMDSESDLETKRQLNGSLIESINNDTTNTLGLIILTYMEDRRCTSKILQNVRYLVMTMLSIYRSPNSVFEKCLEPIRSPLQLFFLKNMISFTRTMLNVKLSSTFTYGTVRFDSTTQTFIDNLGGARIMLPRPLIHDKEASRAEFSEILSEMYFSMLFNKNQDDPTHSSFQILSKMLEGEESMQEVKSQGNHLGYKPGLTNNQWAKFVVDNPHSHQFSSKAIEVGARLIRKSLGDDLYTDILIARRKKNVNKTLDEFATFKSSAVNTREIYSKNEIRQNSRRRCVEGVIELVEDGCLNSLDVLHKYLTYPVEFQVFKKNQIGGVREILILSMISRVKINIIETISRNICGFDKREILTHGGKKNEIVKEMLYSAKRLPGKRMNMFLSFDKSRWGPSFVPIQFLYLFTPFKKQLGNMFLYIASQLILHQNKRCMFPEKLVHAWVTDPDNLMTHRKDKRLQNLKEKFLDDKKLYFDNESNMGQGILHYTSSYLHAAMISFRDELYKRACKKLGFDHADHFDVFSSDDSFTTISMEIHKMSKVVKKLDIFMRCQEVSERLFNCSTSRSKSSINPILGEFNSLFMSNLTFFPTLIKFSIAAVHPVNTDSFYRMTKECYAASRQIIENGGTLDLYLVSHQMNKRFCESIYHTHIGGANNLVEHGIRLMPYHLGHYPIFNPSLMLMFGPEFYNYSLYKQFKDMNDQERNLFSNSHKIIKGGLVETMAELEEGETMLGGLLRIEASIGPIRQHQRVMKLVEERMMDKKTMESSIVNNPLILFDPASTDTNVRFRVSHKLMVPGAKEAMKLISSSIYFGRMSATVSAKAFYIPNHIKEEKTYIDCMMHLINVEKKSDDLDKNIQFLYPKWPEYELFINEVYKPIPSRFRHIMDVQTIRTLSVFKVGTNLTNTIYDVLDFLWNNKKVSDFEVHKFSRDVEILKSFYPMMKDSLEETKEQFSGTDLEKTKAIILLLLKFYSLKDRTIKAILYGSNTSDVRDTYYILNEKNSTIPMQHILKTKLESETKELGLDRPSYDKILESYNYLVLTKLLGFDDLAGEAFSEVTDVEIEQACMDKTLSLNIKKRIFMGLLSHNRIKDVEKWSENTSIILHYWDLRQRYIIEKNEWVGDFVLVIFLGNNKIRVRFSYHQNKYYIDKSDFNDPELLYELFQEFIRIINIDEGKLLRNVDSGDWIIKDKKVLYSPNIGFKISSDRGRSEVFPDSYILDVREDRIFLRTISGRQVYSIGTGLLNHDRMSTTKTDFNCYDIDYSILLKNRTFSHGFDIESSTDRVIHDLLTDMNVGKPNILTATIDGLNLPGQWNTKNIEFKDEDEIVVTKIEAKETSLIPWLLEDDEEEKEILKGIKWLSDDFEDFVKVFSNTDFFDTIQLVSDIQFPRKVLNTIKNLKYDCISISITYMGIVNKDIIYSVVNSIETKKKEVLYSLVSRYDRTISDTGVSPSMRTVFSIDPHLYTIGLSLKPLKLEM